MARLNIFLTRRDIDALSEVVEVREPPLEHIPLALPDGDNDRVVQASLYFDRRPMDLPSWAAYFSGLFNISSLPRVSSCPAVLLVPVDERIFAIVFSHGGSLLVTGVQEPSFGLRVALNAIGPEKMRSYDKKSFDALFRQTREHAAQETKLEAFGIDAERDLVRNVTGKPQDTTLGSSMTGGTSLAVSTKVKPKQLVHLLRRLYRNYQQSLPDEYTWIGCIEEVKEDSIKKILDSYLEERLQEKDKDVWLSVPSIIDWSATDGFRFVLSNRSRWVYPNIEFRYLAEALDNTHPLSVDLLQNKKVEMLDSEHQVLKSWKLYSCVNAEVHLDDETYVLSNGVWYAVDSDLLGEIDRVVEGLPQSDLSLPAFDVCDDGEAGYNQRVATENPLDFCCLDRKDIPFGGGRSKFELCDLLTSSGDMVHVKRGRGPDRLSHLFAQGLISAELVMTRKGVRKKADALVASEDFALSQGKNFTGKHARNVVYAIIGESHQLPVFSRINLRNAIRKLSGYNWGVRLVFVPETDIVKLRKQQKRRSLKK